MVTFGIAAFGAAPHIAMFEFGIQFKFISGIAGATPQAFGIPTGGPQIPSGIGTAGTIITQQLLAILGILLTPHIFLTPLFDYSTLNVTNHYIHLDLKWLGLAPR